MVKLTKLFFVTCAIVTSVSAAAQPLPSDNVSLNIGQSASILPGQSATIYSYGQSSTVTCGGPAVVEIRPEVFVDHQSSTVQYEFQCASGNDGPMPAVIAATQNAKKKCQSATNQNCEVTLAYRFRTTVRDGFNSSFCDVQAKARATGEAIQASKAEKRNSGYVDYDIQYAGNMKYCGMNGKGYGTSYKFDDAMKDAELAAVTKCKLDAGRDCTATKQFDFEQPGGTICRIITYAQPQR